MSLARSGPTRVVGMPTPSMTLHRQFNHDEPSRTPLLLHNNSALRRLHRLRAKRPTTTDKCRNGRGAYRRCHNNGDQFARSSEPDNTVRRTIPTTKSDPVENMLRQTCSVPLCRLVSADTEFATTEKGRPPTPLVGKGSSIHHLHLPTRRPAAIAAPAPAPALPPAPVAAVLIPVRNV